MKGEGMKSCLIISDFNIGNFNGYLSNIQGGPKFNIIESDYGQVQQLLFDEKSPCWIDGLDIVVVWTQPQITVPSFGSHLMGEDVSVKQLIDEVDQFSDLLVNISGRVRTVLIPSWVIPSYNRGMGILDQKYELGTRNLLSIMNLRLAENISALPHYFILNTQRWIECSGSSSFNPKLWYLGKIPFGNEVFKHAVEDVKAAALATTGLTKKIIVVDLDDTLWGGIVGDAGKENLVLGGHDPEGEALVDFQKSLKALTNRGILLGIVSKNDESIALDAIRTHPEMFLKVDDFAGWRINWDDKAKNLVDLITELNLGLSSVVFIDDNPVERARVREALPEVFVPEWPIDKVMYQKTLLELTCFDAVSLTTEDRGRAKMYAGERERKTLKQSVNSLDDWLHTLEVRIAVEELDENNIVRATQLLNKTNQMNLSTRRLTETEFMEWSKTSGNKVLALRVSDRFGDMGLTGLLSFEIEVNSLKIVDYVLSCRVMGRKIEETMIALAAQYAKNHKVINVYARYIPTAKNKPCLEFFKRSSLVGDEDNLVFSLESGVEIPFPPQITLERNDQW